MASEISLPAPAMESILSFLDARDLATMAQTCQTWKRIVYRKSVWSGKNIQFRRCATLILDKVPARARHIGTPTQLCFLHWLQEKSLYSYGRRDILPLHIQHITDPKEFMKTVYGHWRRHGSPCIVHEHHKIQDLLRMPFPASFSKNDRHRVLCRLVGAISSDSRNVYSNYLEQQYTSRIMTLGILPLGIVPDSSDPLHRFMMEAHTAAQARMEAINAAVLAATAVYQACATALTRHGRSEFEANDTWFVREHDGVWNTAGFSFKKI